MKYAHTRLAPRFMLATKSNFLAELKSFLFLSFLCGVRAHTHLPLTYSDSRLPSWLARWHAAGFRVAAWSHKAVCRPLCGSLTRTPTARDEYEIALTISFPSQAPPPELLVRRRQQIRQGDQKTKPYFKCINRDAMHQHTGLISENRSGISTEKLTERANEHASSCF